MFARKNVLSFVLPFFISHTLGQPGGEYGPIQLDVNSQDSIKSAARSLAGGIIAAYNDSLASEDGGIPGLFDGKNEIYFWESGTLWNALLGYSYLTGDSQYDTTISEALQFQLGDYDAFMPPNQTKSLGNDDQSCWALSAMTAAEIGLPKPKDAEWVDYARNVWQIQSERLESGEDKCAGGLRWQIFTFNAGYNYMNAWSNGNFFLLSARLAKFTGNATYSQYADKIFKWSQTVGLVDKNFSVYDGTDSVTNCSEVSKLRWTATHGLYTEGAALMYNITGAQNWTDAVKGFVKSTSVFQWSTGSGILTEYACQLAGQCDSDQRAFKGIFARTFARAALAAPIAADSINKLLTNSAKGAAMACTAGDDPQCSLSWTADNDTDWEWATATDGNIGEVYAALEVMQGLLYPFAKGLKGASASSSANNATGNSTQGAEASGVSGAGTPQNTGAAGTLVASTITVFAVAFAVMLSF
ncbi:mannan endo-1,6-alpha-mannosidase [Parastagonospora nodorum]|nr:mannan endo-1,6-alpha-mannosidase [Parastagonospora nodorum]KAH4299751.1 mannan endo-1,6-alpha-mannosidase [Parastagonospora nodorum]KAH4303962.1 mannan endo-1,6-alpha-mannosidase [Parastagonospora nodorum]KAH4329573.1 mannan endo-1,6-alpha-mannosidase [Parastagonospora nodorum]KAH4348198.1 mannan endo-1,6-alpha-mannosidase [Parastagonospora nodorum]